MVSFREIIELNIIQNIELEVMSYKWSHDIASFNYDENYTMLKHNSTINLAQLEVNNILYVTALIELLGPSYIQYAINQHTKHFSYSKVMQQNIYKFIEWQTYTASSYTNTMRIAYQIIDHKYNTSIMDNCVENKVLNLTADEVGIKTDTRVNFLGRLYTFFFTRRSQVKLGLLYNYEYRNKSIKTIKANCAIYPDDFVPSSLPESKKEWSGRLASILNPLGF